MVALAFAELQVASRQGADWQDGVRAFAQGYRALARAHPHLVLHLISDLESGGEAVPAATESLYAALAATGAPPGLIAHAADLVVDYVHGFALAECTGRLDAPEQVPAWLDRYPAERFPTMRRVVGSLSAADAAGSFEAAIEIILSGISACLDRTDGAARPNTSQSGL